MDAGYSFLVENNHPDIACSLDEFAAFYQWEDGDEAEFIIDRDTIERDDEWMFRKASGDELIPEGRVYIMTADIAYSFGGVPSQLTKAEVHAAAIDEWAFAFFTCW